jgi:hypothetical protein
VEVEGHIEFGELELRKEGLEKGDVMIESTSAGSYRLWNGKERGLLLILREIL